jgi:hypothetical protein
MEFYIFGSHQPEVFDPKIYIAASHILYFPDGKSRVNAIAVSANKALAELHKLFKENQEVQLRDCHGKLHCGKVTFTRYDEQSADIALIELDISAEKFEKFIPVYKVLVTLGMDIHEIGTTTSLIGDETLPYYETGKISLIEPSSIVRISYHAGGGMSGAGVVVAEENGYFHVLGVHIERADETLHPTPINENKKSGGAANLASVSSNSTATSRNIHGHSSYSCFICVAARMDKLLDMI